MMEEDRKTGVEYQVEEPIPRPPGWMYKATSFNIYTFKGKRKWSTSWYASPRIQLAMVAFVCFLCPGMFNALSGLGGGGRKDPTLGDQMNIALYSTFAVVGFFAGTIVNRLGVRLSISFGGIGYCLYSISLLVSVHKWVPAFNIFAGAFLGVCAGLLWAAQGTIMMSYPLEQQKGRYFAWFWGIFNIGGCLGSLIPLGENIHVTTNETVTDGTYIAFIVLMFAGAVLGLGLCDADKVVRSDGSRVILMKQPSWKTEIIGLYQTLRDEPWIILLFPMFWSSNWFYTYQQNSINGAVFNTRTKALNGFLYWFAQIVAAVIIGPLLDIKRVRRTVRAKVALGILLVFTVGIWGGGYAWQKKYTRESVADGQFGDGLGWEAREAAGPIALYFFYGMYDAVWQGFVYWIMGALGNSGRKLANLAGFYKGLQSAGAAVMWSLDSHKLAYLNEWASNFGLLTASILVAAPVIFFKIKDSVPVEDELAGTGETLEDVLPPGSVAQHRVAQEKI